MQILWSPQTDRIKRSRDGALWDSDTSSIFVNYCSSKLWHFTILCIFWPLLQYGKVSFFRIILLNIWNTIYRVQKIGILRFSYPNIKDKFVIPEYTCFFINKFKKIQGQSSNYIVSKYWWSKYYFQISATITMWYDWICDLYWWQSHRYH